MKKQGLLIFFCFSLSLCDAQSGIITTVAGNGDRTASAFSGDGGPATAAELGVLCGLVFDSVGNYYIVDAGNNRVRMVTKATGIINTIVGGGSSANDNIPATDAFLDLPNGITIDKSGNIYIADNIDNAIRKVNLSSGILTTIAGAVGSMNKAYSGDGGLATAAFLDEPNGVALDDTGNLYIADFHNNVIRKITASTGIITTVAGNGFGHWVGIGSWTGALSGDGGPATAAEFYGPDAITFDKLGNMYIADDENNVIRKVTKSTGIINTIAGNGVAGYYGDGGPATVAELWTPTGITVDTAGNLFIGDNTNQVIRMVNTSGIISTIIGNGTSNYTGDGGPATAAELRYPYGITFDPSGNIYVSDAGNYVIRKVNMPTGMNEIKKSESVSIFPNPSSGSFTLELSNTNEKCRIEIYNIVGEKTYTETLQTQDNKTISLIGQPNGIYFYRVLKETGALIGSGKIIIEK